MSAGEGGGGRGALGALYVALQADASGLVRELSAARAAQGRTEKSMDSLDRRARGLRGGFLIAAGGAAAAGVALAALANRGGVVDQQFARIQANSGATAKQMSAMRDEAAAVGQALPTNMQDSADALYELTAAGYSANEATAALPGVSQLAVAGHLSQAEAATTVANALNAYQLPANRAAAAADMLASVSAKSASEVRDLGEAQSYVSATAQQVGLSLEDTTAWAGALSQVGQVGTRAGTSMNAALTKAIAPTEQGKQALDQLGLSVDDFRDKAGNLKSTYEIFSTLRQQMQGMSGAERSKLLTQIFGLRGARAVGPLVQPVKPGQVDLLEKMNDLRKDAGQAEVAGGINRLSGLSDDQLQTRQQAVGFKLQPGSMESVLKQYQQQAKKQDWSQAQLQQKLQVGLELTPDTSEALAGDIAKGSDIGKLSDQLDDTVTSQKLATAEMATFKGQVEQTSGALDSLFYNMWQGASGPLTVLMSGVAGVANLLSSNKTVAEAFGVGLVALGVASTVAAVGLGALYAEIKIKALLAAASGTNTLATAQYAQAGASKVAAAGEAIYTAGLEGNLTSLIASTAAEKGKTASRYASAAASKVATGASYAYQAGVWAATVATNGATAAEGLYTAALETETGAMIASRVAQLRGAAARYTAEGASAAAAGAEWAYTTALESETAAAIAARASTLAGTAARSAAAAPTYALAAAQFALEGGLLATAAAGWAAVAPFWPLLAVGAGVAALALGIKTNFLGMGDAFRFVSGVFGDGVSAMLHPIQTLTGAFDAVASHGDLIFDALSAIPGVGLAIWAARTAGGFDALTHPIDTVKGGIDWLLNKIPKLPGPKDIPLLGSAINIGEGLWSAGKGAGKRLSEGVAAGAKNNKKKVGKATDGVAREAADRLPSSNARRGPLSNLLQRGRALPDMLAKGMRGNSGRAGQAAGHVAANVVDALPGGRTALRTAQSFIGGLQRGYRRGGRAHVPAPTVGQPRAPQPAMAGGSVAGTATYRARVRVPEPPALPQGRAMPYRPRVRRPRPRDVGQVLSGGGQILRRLESLFGGGGRKGAIPGADLAQLGPIQHAMRARLGGLAGPNPLAPALDSARRISSILTATARAVSASAGGVGIQQGHLGGERDEQSQSLTRAQPRGDRTRTQITRDRTLRETSQRSERDVRRESERDGRHTIRRESNRNSHRQTQRETRLETDREAHRERQRETHRETERETTRDRQRTVRREATTTRRDTRRESQRRTDRDSERVTRERRRRKFETREHVRTRARRSLVRVSPVANQVTRAFGEQPSERGSQPVRSATDPITDVLRLHRDGPETSSPEATSPTEQASIDILQSAVPSVTQTPDSMLPSMPSLDGVLSGRSAVDVATQVIDSPIVQRGVDSVPRLPSITGLLGDPVGSSEVHSVLDELPQALVGGERAGSQPQQFSLRRRPRRRRRPAAVQRTPDTSESFEAQVERAITMLTSSHDGLTPTSGPTATTVSSGERGGMQTGMTAAFATPAAPAAQAGPEVPTAAPSPMTPSAPAIPSGQVSLMSVGPTRPREASPPITVETPGVAAVRGESAVLRRYQRGNRGDRDKRPRLNPDRGRGRQRGQGRQQPGLDSRRDTREGQTTQDRDGRDSQQHGAQNAFGREGADSVRGEGVPPIVIEQHNDFSNFGGGGGGGSEGPSIREVEQLISRANSDLRDQIRVMLNRFAFGE